MTEKAFKLSLVLLAIAFLILFSVIVIPAFLDNPDIISAFAAGFVNPFSSGYSADVIICWFILAVWVVYERQTLNIKYGYWCLLVGLIPGVAMGLAGYLFLRTQQLNTRKFNKETDRET